MNLWERWCKYMLEINSEQFLSFDNVNRVRILKMIAIGLIKYTGD